MPCPICDGEGLVVISDPEEGLVDRDECPRCDGTGEVDPDAELRDREFERGWEAARDAWM